MQALASQHDMVFCATDFWGLAQGDTDNDAAALGNLNLFEPVIDRLQQGALNSLFLGRLMLNRHGLASNAAFEQNGTPLIETSHLYYDGNSQGGIMGGMLTAIAPDWTRAVLGVTGIDYGNLLVQRSHRLRRVRRDPLRELPGPVAASADPRPDAAAVGPRRPRRLRRADDHATRCPTRRRTGADADRLRRLPGVDVLGGGRGADDRRVGLPSRRWPPTALGTATCSTVCRRIAHFPFAGSAIEIWDCGPGRVQPPPLANLAPVSAANNNDPHEDVRNTPSAQLQKSDFLAARAVSSASTCCAGQPCHTYDFTP